MGLQGEHTRQWYERARRALVAGVSSGFRDWGPHDTLVVERGEGAYVYDMDGKRYIDYQLGFGPVILGHGHPEVAAAVAEAAAAGVTFALTQRREIEAAEKVKEAAPWIESLRFTNTGTEATMHAVRLARAFTGREIIVKFEGAYHGAHDYVLFSTASAPAAKLGSRRSPVPWQASSGIPQAIGATVATVPFNDVEAMERLFRTRGHEIAAVLAEPILGNAFAIMPHHGYLAELRRICDDHGALLIFDEVKTGFRLGRGGAWEHFGVTPDLATYAKSMGNGFPVAAVAGHGEAIHAWAHGGITQAGTYSGNGVAVAAAAATLDELATGEPHARIERTGSLLMEGIAKVCADKSQPVHLLGHPAMFGVYFGEGVPRDFRDQPGHDADLYWKVIQGMIERGVLAVDEAMEPFFLSAAHSEEDVAETLTAFEEALSAARG